MKTLKEIQRNFENSLAEIYPKQEIESLFCLVVEHMLGWSKLKLITEYNTLIKQDKSSDIEYIADKLQKNIPIQYVLGETEFYGLRFKLNEHVLIPRQETEELVRWILDSLKNTNSDQPKILDIGTGSGCIPISLEKNLVCAKIFGLDISKEVLQIASSNNRLNSTSVKFDELDILRNDLSKYSNLDVVVSNPPYVLETEKKLMHKNVLEHEPHLALFVNDNEPLLFYSRIANIAFESLKTDGFLFFEINEKYGQETVNLLESLSYKNIQLKKYINGKDRMIRCEKP